MAEEWRPIPGWEGVYEVSNMGFVRSLRRQLMLSSRLSTNGYPITTLSRNGVNRVHLTHRLVLLAFVGPCPDGMEGCHANGDRTDARLENLRWDTHAANVRDAVKHGTHWRGGNRITGYRSVCSGPGHERKRTASGRLRCRECERNCEKRQRSRRALESASNPK